MTIELNSSCFDLHLSKETKTERKQTAKKPKTNKTEKKLQTIRQMFAQYRKQCMLLEPGEC